MKELYEIFKKIEPLYLDSGQNIFLDDVTELKS
jgi:hypothetical protein